MPDTLVVNLFGGPGSGKTTVCCAAFCELKRAGVNCELAPEFAKEVVWDNAHFLLQQNPIWSFSEQHRRIARLIGKVDVAICDSPLLLQRYYQRWSNELDALILAEHRRWPTLNFWIERISPYQQQGRMEDAKRAAEVDIELFYMLMTWGVELIVVKANEAAGKIISARVMEKVNAQG